ncbi:Amino-acid permease [Lachnellula subtilissima]|uniref:Amino-acid permease n=1 Tax=Lachnellula subtilissima TaxID=602034 RepID=A0A8H8RI79_9HELO|nr:Amino-acid permease [Lachnellula subtilissima]
MSSVDHKSDAPATEKDLTTTGDRIDYDVGSTYTSDILPPHDSAGYHRVLPRRQIMMMTIGAGIGTGLWVGTGTALYYAGPAGMAIAYTVMAFVVYEMYMSIGEMTAYKPIHGGFIRQTMEYVDPALGFALGMAFWFDWVMIIPAEITAAITVVDFWPNSVPTAAWITIFLVVIAVVNIFEVKIYGHVEFYMSFLKVLAIVAMIFFMIIMTSGGIPGTPKIEFTFWKKGMAFKNGFKGLMKAFLQAGFSFGGGEHIAVIAGEAMTPRKTIKSTIRPLFWRMGSFFVLNIWLVGMCVSPNDKRLVSAKGTLASPFVIAIENTGHHWLAHVLNAFILLTVISCGITAVYIASRTLTALSDLKLIHPFFAYKDKKGRPVVGLVLSLVLGGGLCYLNCNNTALEVYTWFSSLVGLTGFIMWGTLYIQHIRFRHGLKAQGISYKTLPFRDYMAPYGQYVVLAIIIFLLVGEAYLALSPVSGAKPSAKNFFSTYIAAPLFVADYLGYKFWFKTKFVKASNMDFTAAIPFDEEDRQMREEKARNPPPKKTLRHKITSVLI